MVAIFPSRTIVLQFFGLTIYWYGLFYVVAWGLGALLLKPLLRLRNLTLHSDQRQTLLLAVMAAVVVGGRLGYVFFYEPAFFWQHPGEIFALWRGGMSLHGGFLGVGLLLGFLARRWGISLLALADVVVVPAALGLALGRLGNFINQELYGTVTDLPWGIVIPEAEGARHPVQLYAVAKNIVIAAICYFRLRKSKQVGEAAAFFLLLYGVGRFLLEYVRVSDYPLFMLWGFSFTRGQLYTLPLIAFAALLLYFIFSHQKKNPPTTW